jgi:diguanylate cyclase (GGDEF)-like protein
VARGTLLGLIGAGFSHALGHEERTTVLERLIGVGDQAATALDNAHLVDHIRHQALHDALTGLPNRALVEDRFGHALEAARRSPHDLTLLFIDLDRFKNVNDTLGHRAGDEIIREVVRRLQGVTRSCDTLGRLGGDEFVVLITDTPSDADVAEIPERLLGSLREPFSIDGHQLFISCSIGVAVTSSRDACYETLVQWADAAMYEAKARGGNTFAVHAADPTATRRDLLELETALHLALPNEELTVEYQPQVDLRTMQIVSVEALVRWHHPTRGTIGPDDFIPVAEQSGLIVGIDRWVRRTALRQARSWQDLGLPPVRIALNLSTREIRNPSLADDLAAEIAAAGLDPAMVEIEVTERVVMAEEELPTILQALRAIGVRLAIDDFGTGTSVLSRLQRCPVNTLKIDKSFVQEITSVSANAIVAALVQMARTLDLEIVAEGVETGVQATALQALGCHLAQGFFFSRPATPARIQQLLERGLAETCGSDVARPLGVRAQRRRRPTAAPSPGTVADTALVNGPTS